MLKTLSIWDSVPDSETLKAQLKTARDTDTPVETRLSAVRYLSGAVKVLDKIEKRERLARYLKRQVRALTTEINETV